MNCPGCGAPMRLDHDKDYFECDYCRNIHFPEPNEDGARVLDEAADFSCPVCHVPLWHASLAGCRILYCSRCRGMLIAMAVFVEVIRELRTRHDGTGAIFKAPEPRSLDRKTGCPQCHQRMDTHFYAGPGNIVIDDCSRCHLNWLDYGEMKRIVNAPDRTYSE